MALTIFEETFGKERVRFGKVSKRDATVDHLVAITHAVQAVVDTFVDPRTGDRYIVSLSNQTEAYTMPGHKRVVVSYKPIFDKGLKVSTAATVMTGLVLHEIGHTLYTFPNLPAIEAAFGRPQDSPRWGAKKHDQLAYTMLNIGDDARLEARMSEQLPIARDIFPTMLHWVALNTGMVGNRLRWTGSAMKLSDRVNFACRSSRYPWTATWSSDSATRAERLWWQDWGRRYIAVADRDGEAIVVLVKEACERLRNAGPVEVEPPTTCDYPVGPTDEPPDTDEPKTKTPDKFGDDFTKEPVEDEDDEDEDDEDEDDDGDADDVRDPWDEEDDEDEDEDEPKGGSKSDAPPLDEPEPSEDKPEGESEGKGDEPDPDAPREFPQDFDAHDLNGNVDNINHPEDWKSQSEGNMTQRVMDIDASTERVPTGVWGTAKVEVMNIEQRFKR